MVKELLLEFCKANNGYKPEKLIFYRDGVSEGQFETVQRLEIPQACCSPAAINRMYLVDTKLRGGCFMVSAPRFCEKKR